MLNQDQDSAYVRAYDAARYSGTAILAHKGLRPTTSGGHYAVEVALRAQYPTGTGETTTHDAAR